MTSDHRRLQVSNAFGRNAALVAAVLGWLFDGFEIGLFPLVGPRALVHLPRRRERVAHSRNEGPLTPE
jgi:hypothetical protein